MSSPEVNAAPTAAMVRREEDDKTIFGFWLYLMTDCVLFASLFATYAVLRTSTFGGPGGGLLFSMNFVLAETLILLTSSFSCGLGILAARQNRKNLVLAAFGLTFLLGLAFLSLELHEFSHLYHEGDSWRRSGFLSAFFTLVGTHGLHISVGLLWMGTLMVRVYRAGLNRISIRQLTLMSMFWHFLDIIWIFIFTIVDLMGIVL
jgi:cytochrome o ubiquinol oxidase subunit 3